MTLPQNIKQDKMIYLNMAYLTYIYKERHVYTKQVLTLEYVLHVISGQNIDNDNACDSFVHAMTFVNDKEHSYTKTIFFLNHNNNY
jgi:hypothetical protein